MIRNLSVALSLMSLVVQKSSVNNSIAYYVACA